MEGRMIMAWFFAIVGVLMLFVPIAYTFLRLAHKIGPDDDEDAFWVGIVLWSVCGATSVGFIEQAMKLLGH